MGFQATLDPIKAGFARYLAGYHQSIIPDSDGVAEFRRRSFANAFAYAPGRMVDDADSMLKAWRRNDNTQSRKYAPFLPVVLVAIAKDLTNAPSDWAQRIQGDAVPVQVDGDPLNRWLDLRTMPQELRVQVLFVASNINDAHSLFNQFRNWVTRLENRRFSVEYTLAGQKSTWPAVITDPDVLGSSIPSDAKNITLITADLAIKATIPLIVGAGEGMPNDGQGSGTQEDPYGLPLVKRVDVLDSGSNFFWRYEDAP